MEVTRVVLVATDGALFTSGGAPSHCDCGGRQMSAGTGEGLAIAWPSTGLGAPEVQMAAASGLVNIPVSIMKLLHFSYDENGLVNRPVGGHILHSNLHANISLLHSRLMR